MITSIVGRLIKKPEVAERIQIAGKHVVNFTVVENRNRGERRLSVFFNLSVIIGTDAQFDLVMRLDKGTVLMFSAPRITYVRQSDRSESEQQQQTINIYADADNFKIVAGAVADSSSQDERSEAPTPAAPMSQPPPQQPRTQGAGPDRPVPPARGRAAVAADDLHDLDDPFAESEPARARSGTPNRAASPAELPPRSPSAPRQQQRRPVAPPVVSEDLDDPFADSDL